MLQEAKNEYNCSQTVSGLINSEKYSFYLSAFVNGEEVFLNNEANATPTLAQ